MRRALPLHVSVLLAGLVIGAVLVGPGLGGFFILDDFAWLDCAADALGHPAHLFTLHISNFFRPVAHGVWTLAHWLFGLEPGPYHLLVLGLHAIAAVLFAHLIWRLSADRFLAFACAVCFLLSPAYSEAVIWISGVTEPIAAIGILATLIAFHRFLTRREGLFYGLALLVFVLAHGTKESVVVLLPLLAMLHLGLWLRQPGTARGSFWIYLPFALLGIAYLLLQYRIQQQSYLVIERQYTVGFHALGGIARSLAHLLRLGWPPLVAAILGWLLQHRALPRLTRKRLAWAALLLAAVVVPMIPYAMFRGDALASRYYYLPSLGLALASGLALRTLFRQRSRSLQVLGILSLAGLALHASWSYGGAVERYLRAARRTEQFVHALRHPPSHAGDAPVLLLDPLLHGQHLAGMVRLFLPDGSPRIREVTREELRGRPPGTVWRYGGGVLEPVDVRSDHP